MIDYFFRFTDEAEAIAEAGVSSGYYKPPIAPTIPAFPGGRNKAFPGGWNSDRVLPGVKAWRPSQDVGGVHNYLTGWFAIVSMPNLIPALLNHPNLQFALDREKCNAHLPFVVRNNIGGVIQDVACDPTFSGCTYPIGGYD